ncbi:hypothetical protein BV394_01920 [Brevirhabdus pacifica]|uniref:Uncharacterized protein n=1 Tax=Brevirhabdus pacifica TaxID=1267768 RepID=A0A1U7DFI2_9RHOB|nr:hypothetical protein [Brevirhabdus pacifica]APX88638.1 hypothetical protein BV394_01920 [Brevirhabdus pacifica]OWU79912.1 hypothetical protein ATO5_02610 [Loktanella sp. 22II-4b]PJJ86862.1 hypothetical protein CLV77_1422 [Brevirhabdus pacifica]
MSIKQAAENAIFSYPKDTANQPSTQGIADLFENIRYAWDTAAEFKADTTASYTLGAAKYVAAGDIVLIGGVRAVVLASGSAGHLASAAATPVQVDILLDAKGGYSAEAFGLVRSGGDVTSAVQAAVTAARTKRVDKVTIPAADAGVAYGMTSTLTHAAGSGRLILEGAGKQSTTLLWSGLASTAYALHLDKDAVDVAYHFGIRDITLRGDTTGTRTNGALIENASYCDISDTEFYGFRDGLVYGGTSTFSNGHRGLTFYDISRYGVHFEAFTGGGHYTFGDSTVTGDIGIYIDSASAVSQMSLASVNFEQTVTNEFRCDGDLWGLDGVIRTEGCNGAYGFLFYPATNKTVAGFNLHGSYFTSDAGAHIPIFCGGNGGKVAGGVVSGNYIGFATIGSHLLELNGTGEAIVVQGNYGENLAATIRSENMIAKAATWSAGTDRADNALGLYPGLEVASAGSTQDRTSAPCEAMKAGIEYHMRWVYAAGTSANASVQLHDTGVALVASGTVGNLLVTSNTGATDFVVTHNKELATGIWEVGLRFKLSADSSSLWGFGPYSTTVGQTAIVYFGSVNGPVVKGLRAGVHVKANSNAAGPLAEYEGEARWKLEQKSWTPVDKSGAGLTFTSASGSYQVIGDTCEYRAVIVFPTTTDTTQVTINMPVLGDRADTSSRAGMRITSTYGTAISGFHGFPTADKMQVFTQAGLGGVTNANLSGQTLYLSGSFKVA